MPSGYEPATGHSEMVEGDGYVNPDLPLGVDNYHFCGARLSTVVNNQYKLSIKHV